MAIKKILTVTTLVVVLSSFLVGCNDKDINDISINEDIAQENILDEKEIVQNSNNSNINSTIEEIEDMDELAKEVTYYIPNDNVDGLTKVTLRGNVGDEIAMPQYLIDRFIKEGFIAKDTKVNKFSEMSEGVYNLDLSKEFYELSFGTSAEGLILDSIGNSFIENYSIEKLKLTIDGENYVSGHILMEDNDYLTYVELDENSTETVKTIE